MKDYIINSNDTLLLMIDIQDRLFQAMEIDSQNLLKKNGATLLNTAAEFNIPLIISEQYRKGLGETIPELRPLAGEYENLEKIHFDCMKNDEIKNAIHKTNKKTIIITGIESHICVLQTSLSLLASGFKVVIASDAVASRRKQDYKSALRILSEAGAIVYPTETIAFMLLEKAGTPEFKKLSPLFK